MAKFSRIFAIIVIVIFYFEGILDAGNTPTKKKEQNIPLLHSSSNPTQGTKINASLLSEMGKSNNQKDLDTSVISSSHNRMDSENQINTQRDIVAEVSQLSIPSTRWNIHDSDELLILKKKPRIKSTTIAKIGRNKYNSRINKSKILADELSKMEENHLSQNISEQSVDALLIKQNKLDTSYKTDRFHWTIFPTKSNSIHSRLRVDPLDDTKGDMQSTKYRDYDKEEKEMAHLIKEKGQSSFKFLDDYLILQKINKKYEYVGDVGRGAYGIISNIKERLTGKIFVMKEISLERDDGSGKTAVLAQREVDNLTRVKDCEYFAKIHEAFSCFYTVWIIMECIDGVNLDVFSRQYFAKMVPEKFAVKIVYEILIALEYLHSRNIVHRDIKPQNIMITNDGSVKLVDFGCSKFLPKGKLTRSFVGTRDFLSPEIISRKEYSFYVDFYELGVLFFVILAGKDISNWEYGFGCRSCASYSLEARDLIAQLTHEKVENRLILASEIKKHKIFEKLRQSILNE